MSITETQICDGAKAIEDISYLEKYQLSVSNIDMKTTLQQVFDNINNLGMDGAELLDEFKAKLSNLIIKKKSAIKSEFLEPIGYIKNGN